MSRNVGIGRRVGPILWLEHVTKQYGRRRVLDDIDASFARGTLHLLTGPNGAGKTTLLRLLSTAATPNAGTIHWVDPDGTELRDAVQVRAKTGYAGHTPLVWDELTLRENLEFQLRLRKKSVQVAQDWLVRFGLGPRADDRADTLSRGMRQRLALVLALAPKPDFLLLDEPASNLDAQSLQRLVEALDESRGRATCIIATHDPDPFRHLADRTLRLADGKVGPTEAAAP